MKIYTDGVFDLFHYGHVNALRQAKLLGSYLIVGVNSSESASDYKNNPILTNDERLHVLRACRWVDQVIPNAPYFLDYEMIKQLECNLVVHGDDEIVDADGNNCYADALKNNKYMMFERSKGISTSEIVGRLLYKECRKIKINEEMDSYHDNLIELCKLPEKQVYGKIAYIAGTFDLYHAGNVALMEEAKTKYDYLVVGLYNDNDTLNYYGEPPIMKEKERKLCLLSNKFIDQIIDNAPIHPDSTFINHHKIEVIYCGKESEYLYHRIRDDVEVILHENKFNYLNCNLICDRIITNFKEYSKKVEKNCKD